MIRKHSVKLRGHATSVSLEDEFWFHVKQIANKRNQSVQKLLEELDATLPHDGSTSMSSQLRLMVLKDLENQLAER